LKAHKATRIPSKSLEWSSVEEEQPFPGLCGKMWPGSLNLAELHHIFPHKPGNGCSSSTEDHSRLLDGILVALWAFNVCLISQFG
jgi:hypothetical protein